MIQLWLLDIAPGHVQRISGPLRWFGTNVLEIANIKITIAGQIPCFKPRQRALVHAQMASHCGLPHTAGLAECGEGRTEVLCNHIVFPPCRKNSRKIPTDCVIYSRMASIGQENLLALSSTQ